MTSAGESATIDAAVGRRGVTEALYGELSSGPPQLALHEVSPLPLAFRMMIERRSFGVAEMALTTLAMAIDHGRPLIGLPIVLLRDFHFGSIVVGTNSGITTPDDLRGRRIGVRAYSQTTGVWVRGLLSTMFGLLAESMQWVTLEGAHVPEYADPPHVIRSRVGSSLGGLLAAGEIDAAVAMEPRFDPAVAVPLFPDADERAAAEFHRAGVFPVNHVVAVDTELIDRRPEVVAELSALLVESKRRYVRGLAEGGPQNAYDRRALRLAEIVGGDFNPYGMEPNRRSCTTLLRYAYDQGLLSRALTVDEVFHPGCPEPDPSNSPGG